MFYFIVFFLKILEQDGMMDELHCLLVSTRNNNKEIENEIKNQKPLLDNLEKDMDGVQSRIKRTSGKLNQYFEKSSNGCLMTIICLQVVLLLIIILAL